MIKIMKKITFFSFKVIILNYFFLFVFLNAQTHLPADPFYLLHYEKMQFDKRLPMLTNIFRPLFFDSDTTSISLNLRSEMYFNNNAPNQENMDVRYFSKGISNFNSIQIALNSRHLFFLAEPYMNNNFNNYKIKRVNRSNATYDVLNDNPLSSSSRSLSTFRNLLAFVHYKGIGIGFHSGNRWWGPGVHSSLQMSNNTVPIPANIIGTLKEIRYKSLGFFGLYTFARMNDAEDPFAEYFTSLNGQITWYGPIIITAGFSRNYLTGGVAMPGYQWSINDAKKIIFEGIFISNLLSEEYTVGGHDYWDQTLSTYFSVTLPNRDLKIYAEMGVNDNRMYFADLLSQPDHSMATIFGIRDYGIGESKNWIWGFEWTNLMITYSSRHRPFGGGNWYQRDIYDYSSYKGRRWGAHSGADSDDWYLYVGYLSDKYAIIPAINYERHGIVSFRPAEVKLEFRLDTKFNYKDTWFGIYIENQFEAFLGFPGYYYVDVNNNPTGYVDRSKLANTRKTNTIIFSISKNINL